LAGNREMLRALRAAEMAAWEAAMPSTTVDPSRASWSKAQPQKRPFLLRLLDGEFWSVP